MVGVQVNLADVMDEIGDRLATIEGLRVYRYPADTVQPPAAVVMFPDDYEYDSTYARGMDRIMNLPVAVMVGKASDRASRDQIAKWADGSGVNSIKQVLEAEPTYSAFDTLRVTSVAFDIFLVASVEHLTATFTLDISGGGS